MGELKCVKFAITTKPKGHRATFIWFRKKKVILLLEYIQIIKQLTNKTE